MVTNNFPFLIWPENLPEIDLHGIISLSEAESKLDSALFNFYKNNVLTVRIIHGFGTGKLREMVKKNLNKNPLVKDWQEEEGRGTCVVVLG